MRLVNWDMKDFQARSFFCHSSCDSISSCKTSTKLSHLTWQENRARTRRYNMLDSVNIHIMKKSMECFLGSVGTLFTPRLLIKSHKSSSESLNDQYKGEMIGQECSVFFFWGGGHAQLKLKPVGGWLWVGTSIKQMVQGPELGWLLLNNQPSTKRTFWYFIWFDKVNSRNAWWCNTSLTFR